MQQAHSRYAAGTEDMSVASSSAPSDSQTALDLADREKGEHGCTHYRRRCRLVAPCCGEVFWCRHCHNESKSQDEMVCCKPADLFDVLCQPMTSVSGISQA